MSVVARPGRDRGRSQTVLVTGSDAVQGTGVLGFARVRGRTVLTRAFAASPLKVLNPRHGGSSAWVYLSTYGGGLVGGDATDLRVDVGEGAVAVLATQASTKVYRSDRSAAQSLRARVAAGGLLVVWPEPVTCFAGSRYRQDQQITLDPDANLVMVDRLTAGRIASGERWRFDEYVSRVLVTRGGRLLLHDALALGAEDGDIVRRLGRFNVLALLIAIGPKVAATVAQLADAFESAPFAARAEVLYSTAPVGEDGAMLRIAGISVEHVAAMVRHHLRFVAPLLGEDPYASDPA